VLMSFHLVDIRDYILGILLLSRFETLPLLLGNGLVSLHLSFHLGFHVKTELLPPLQVPQVVLLALEVHVIGLLHTFKLLSKLSTIGLELALLLQLLLLGESSGYRPTEARHQDPPDILGERLQSCGFGLTNRNCAFIIG
jgi:hypothetical protein